MGAVSPGASDRVGLGRRPRYSRSDADVDRRSRVAGRPGHESLGLALSLLSLGARSTIAAVAPVPDDVAAATMERHHQLLAAGVPADEALARAVDEIGDVAAAFLNLGGQYRP